MAASAPTPQARAISADYSGAISVARSAKNWLFLLLLVMLLTQLGLFCLYRFGGPLDPAGRGVSLLQYVIALSDFAAVALVIVLSMVLLLIVNIMLVGRVIGLERLLSAYVWCLVLAVLLFPWQTVLTSPSNTPSPPAAVASAAGASASKAVEAKATDGDGEAAAGGAVPPPALVAPAGPDFKVPGVLYTWAELTHPELGGRFSNAETMPAILHWSRYVGFPVIAVVLLLIVQAKSSRGLKMAMGEVAYTSPAEET